MESAILYVVALAVPLWLVAETVMHGERSREVKTRPAAAAPARLVRASRVA